MAKKVAARHLWQVRGWARKSGTAIGDALELWKEASSYFDWIDRNPWTREELVKHDGEATAYKVNVGRPYTLTGLCQYLGVSEAYFRATVAMLEERKEAGTATEADLELMDVIEYIKTGIKTQQLEGAILGSYSPNIVARINGLADNVNNNNVESGALRLVVRDQKDADNINKLKDKL